MKARKARVYEESFKRDCVLLYFSQGKSLKSLGKELGVPETTLGGRVNSGRYQGEVKRGSLDPKAVEEMKRLRRELIELREERD
jgi:transposase-like protein